MQGPNGSSLQELLPCPISSKQWAVLCRAAHICFLPSLAGKASSSPHTEQQPGMQCRASGLVLIRGVLNMSIIEVFRGRWRKAFLAHGLAVCCIGKGMAPGHGSGKRLLCGGAVRTAGHSTLGSCRTGREVLRQWW